MTSTDPRWTPAERLAQRVVQRLKTKNLIGEKDSASLQVKMSRGQLTSADWRVVFEKSLGLHKKAQHHRHDMLQKLEVDALRGATKPLKLTFEKGKKITIIYGDNGSGKSTICDAFELLANGKIGSLENKGLGRTERYWHSTGKSSASLRVALATSGGSWTAKVVQSKAVITPHDPKPLIKVLRRETLQQLIAREPASRFEVVRPFLDIAAIEQSESSLKNLVTDLGDSRNEAATRINETFPASFTEAASRATHNSATEEDLGLAAQDLVASIPTFRASLTSALDKRREQKGFLQTLKLAIATYDSNYAARKDLDVLVPIVESALGEVQQERHAFVNETLDAIATRVSELYEKIHPGEGLGKIKLLLDPGKKASLDIQAIFPGVQGAPPGAYFSTSHLDSLGLCIFISLAEQDDPGNTVLVLDDVVASFDEPHVDRLVEVLYEVAQKFQHAVCTTHYRPWREKYRWGLLQRGECQFVELLPWQYTNGIRYGKLVPPPQELRDLLAAPQPSGQLVCASAGVILEAILDFLTHLYECSVPRRRSRPTLGDLLPAVNKKLRSALKVERADSKPGDQLVYKEHKLGPTLDELEKIAQARNIFGCHFNDLAGHLPPQDAIRFSESVLDLAEHLIDPDYGWPRSDRSGSYWANSGQTRRLHPLKQPS